MRFQDRVVIVTGGGYGIGRALALAFGREGAHVMLAGRSAERLRAVAGELRALGTRPGVFPLDVRDENAVRDMTARTLAGHGRIDTLVNNSGVAGPTALARDITREQWLETLDVNLTGTFHCSKHVSAAMIAARRGSIVNIASNAGRIGFGLRTPYAASKWGMIGLSHSLAAELGPYGIRVNAVLPGAVEGERFGSVIAARARAVGKTYEQQMEERIAAIPLRRLVTEEEVALAAAFLASDAAAGITGQAFSVDGGDRMQ
jgi:NAD(P)-dependent dehydrogenase (short-subunit alcohol dehydrogenase family)